MWRITFVLPALASFALVPILTPGKVCAQDSQARARMHQVEAQFLPSVPADGTPVHPTTLEKRMAELHIPGVSIAVVLQLAEAGKINLDHQANEYLKDWKIPEIPFTVKSKVTVAELLNHTAGINIGGFPGYTSGQPIPTLAQMLRGQPPAFGPAIAVTSVPGSEFRYAGGGYVILRALLADMTGKPFEQLMHDTVLLPLGMTHSTFQQPLPADLAVNAAWPHDADGQVFAHGARIYPELAPDGLWTTATDIAHYILAMQKSLRGDGFLSREMARKMFTPGKNHWGLGPILGKDDPGHPYFMFSGGNYGFISVFVAYENGDGVVMLTNGEKGGWLIQEVVHTVARVYGWPDLQPVQHQSVALALRSLDGLEGVYRDASGNALAITRKRDGLYLVRIGGQDGPVRLYAQSKDKFLFETNADQNTPETAEVRVTFERAADGRGQTLKQVTDGSPDLSTAARLASVDEQPILAQLKQAELRYETQSPAPEGADALRRLMTDIDAGKPENSPLGPGIANVLRIDRTSNAKLFGAMGPITSILYKGTIPGGWDTYRVLFRKGDCVFRILVGDHGLIQDLTVRVN